ncbi:MAG: cupin domain-containing protein [Halioglobus sp.]
MSTTPDIRRVVTGHNKEGRAHIRSDETFTPSPIPTGDAEFALLWTTATLPADNNDETDGRLREAGLTIQQGSVIRVVDMLPGGASPMHRSNSIDYGIVVSGEVELELDDGEKTVLCAGDICIQRGTIHLWRTIGDQPCRIVFVLTQAEAYRHQGAPLPEIDP